MKKCLILVNAYSKLKSALHCAERLREEFALLGVCAEVRPNDFVACRVEEGGGICRSVQADFVVYLDKDKYAARMLEATGVRLFNTAAAIEDCDDKMLTLIRLAKEGVPVPRTLPGPLCYTPGAEVKKPLLDEVERSLGYPVVVKSSYGSLGSGVFLAENRAELQALSQQLISTPHLFQRFVSSSRGRDARVIVVGGRVIAAMTRRSEGDFRSNIEIGGRGEKLLPDGELEELSQRVARVICPDYCGVDVLFGEEGYLVCEVNSNAFFGGIEGVTGVNVARAYARYMCGQIYGKEV